MRTYLFLFVLLVLAAGNAFAEPQAAPPIPSRAEATALFDKLVQDIERLDGDGLTIRHQRPEQWKATIARLRAAAAEATTPAALGHVFHRLRATYPNMHAGITLANDFNEKWMPNGASLPMTIRAETLAPDATRPVMRIASINEGWLKTQSADTALPIVGDIVVAMNQRPMADWLRENEIFCRYPLAGQCPVEFQRNSARGFLFWQPETPLVLTLSRDGKIVQATVNIMPSAAPPATSSSTVKDIAKVPPPCDSAKPRMPQGYVLAWAGTMVCVFANPAQPDTQIWRIETFAAEQSRVFDAKPGQYKSVKQETDAFYDEFWKSHAPKVKHLIIDVAGNSGGEVVVRWHQLLFPKPFQMDYVEYKKIREFDHPKVRNALFWGSQKSQEFVEQLKRDGSFEKIAEGGWLPRQQAFCFSEDNDKDNCNTVQHMPRPHGFIGNVTLVIDQFCNSACVTFAHNLRDKMTARVVGLPDVADTTFSRLQLHFGFDANGKPITSIEDASVIAKPVGRFTLAATRTSDNMGNIISAKPLMPDQIVPRRWWQNGDEWAREAISVALKKLE
jgi:Peptidase family S41